MGTGAEPGAAASRVGPPSGRLPVGTRRVLLAINSVNTYGRQVIRGVMDFCHRNPHWSVALEPPWIFTLEPLSRRPPVDGLIVQASDPELIEWARATGRPVVNVGNVRALAHAAPTVFLDDPAVGRLAADHLLSPGFPHYAVCFTGQVLFSRLRRDAFVGRVRAAGHVVAECDVGTTEAMSAAPAADLVRLDRWLADLPKPTAVFCPTDLRAQQVLAAARRVGSHVPDEVAVLGVGDDELSNLIGSVPLSSVAVPSARVGFTAATILEGMLNGTAPDPPPLTRLPPQCVIPRASTDATFIADPEVAAAARFIGANANRPLAVSDVLDHVPIGRRSLERRFRAVVGRSVASEIRRTHVRQAQQLLASTDLSVEEVALASGFTSATRLGVRFRKVTGLTPTGYRRRVAMGEA